MANFEKFITFQKGTFPIIISVPHGGNLEINDLPARKSGILGPDKKTIELATQLIDELNKLDENRQCSYIISKVPRSKIDLNRQKNEAFTPGSELALKIYRFYHAKIKEYIEYNLMNFKRSLLIDIHGFEKHKRPEGFRDVDIILGTNNLESIYSKQIPKKDWDKNLRGRIVKRFIELGIPIAPGHQRRREYVLTGGYITKTYGAKNIKSSQTIQIEFSDRVRIEDSDLRDLIVHTLVEILHDESMV